MNKSEWIKKKGIVGIIQQLPFNATAGNIFEMPVRHEDTNILNMGLHSRGKMVLEYFSV